MTEQVLTRAGSWPDQKSFADQGPTSIYEAAAEIVRHLYVRHNATTNATAPAPPPIPKAGGAGAQRKRRRSKKPKLGGWPSTKCISRKLYWETIAKAGLLVWTGYPFTIFATARAPRGLSDGEAKRHVTMSFARLGQALERKGHGYIGLKAYEKKLGGLLHGHPLLHVRRECLSVVNRWADRFDERRPAKPREPVEGVALHARPAVRSDLGYVLKQRQFNGPFEHGRFYEKGEPITGTRVSFTKMALAIIGRAEGEQATNKRTLAEPQEQPALAASRELADVSERLRAA